MHRSSADVGSPLKHDPLSVTIDGALVVLARRALLIPRGCGYVCVSHILANIA